MRTVILTMGIFAIAGCGAHHSSGGAREATPAPEDSRIANLQRAAQYPWTDYGACAVREAAGPWRTLVERCYQALDLARIQFRDVDHRCGVAQADAATIGQIVGICLLVQPELVVGAVVVVGVVVVAAAIAAELQKKEPCKCACMGLDGRGKTHGPYRLKPTPDLFTCRKNCEKEKYRGGAFCL